MLRRTGLTGATGGGVAAADLLAQDQWAESTWRNRASQLRRWLAFCDDDERVALPAEEGDVLAYIGFLSMEGRVAPRSARQYVSAVSQYHLDHGYASPTSTRTVARLLDAYANQAGRVAAGELTRTGCDAGVMRRVLRYGLQCMCVADIGRCAAVVFAFVFQCRAVTVAHLTPEDVNVTMHGITANLTHRKGKALRRPLVLEYPADPSWCPGTGPHHLLQRWLDIRPPGRNLFAVRAAAPLGSASLAHAVARALDLVGVAPPPGFYFGSHSPRIGGFNELVHLQFTKVWLMHRLDWSSEAMFSVYFDSRILFTADSDWFFGHLRAGPAAACGPSPVSAVLR